MVAARNPPFSRAPSNRSGGPRNRRATVADGRLSLLSRFCRRLRTQPWWLSLSHRRSACTRFRRRSADYSSHTSNPSEQEVGIGVMCWHSLLPRQSEKWEAAPLAESAEQIWVVCLEFVREQLLQCKAGTRR